MICHRKMEENVPKFALGDHVFAMQSISHLHHGKNYFTSQCHKHQNFMFSIMENCHFHGIFLHNVNDTIAYAS